MSKIKKLTESLLLKINHTTEGLAYLRMLTKLHNSCISLIHKILSGILSSHSEKSPYLKKLILTLSNGFDCVFESYIANNNYIRVEEDNFKNLSSRIGVFSKRELVANKRLQ